MPIDLSNLQNPIAEKRYCAICLGEMPMDAKVCPYEVRGERAHALNRMKELEDGNWDGFHITREGERIPFKMRNGVEVEEDANVRKPL